MVINKILIVLVLAVVMSGNALAWTTFHKNYDIKNRWQEISYDENSVQINGNFVNVWSEVLYKEKEDGNPLNSLRFLHRINCESRESKFLSQYVYDKNKNLIASPDFDTVWYHIPPNSIVEYIMLKFCG
jgi:hypothetical protein